MEWIQEEEGKIKIDLKDLSYINIEELLGILGQYSSSYMKNGEQLKNARLNMIDPSFTSDSSAIETNLEMMEHLGSKYDMSGDVKRELNDLREFQKDLLISNLSEKIKSTNKRLINYILAYGITTTAMIAIIINGGIKYHGNITKSQQEINRLNEAISNSYMEFMRPATGASLSVDWRPIIQPKDPKKASLTYERPLSLEMWDSPDILVLRQIKPIIDSELRKADLINKTEEKEEQENDEPL